MAMAMASPSCRPTTRLLFARMLGFRLSPFAPTIFLAIDPRPQSRLPISLKPQFPGTTTLGMVVSATHPLDIVILPNGVHMPRLGFGTAGLGEATERATSWALEAGYRLIDSAQATEWYNEKAVGRAIRSSAVPRDQLFLVSKLHPRHLGCEVTKQQFSTSLQDLGTSHLDLFLLHYPRCFSAICHDMKHAGSWQESWKALEALHDDLKIRAIGVGIMSVQSAAS